MRSDALSSFSPRGTGILPVSGFSGVSEFKPIYSLRESERHLPHIEMPGSSYFIRFSTIEPRLLTEQARDIVASSLFFHDAKKYNLFAYVIMPDHIHIIIEPLRKGHGWFRLSEIIHSIKSYTAVEINKREKAEGTFWQDEFYDHIIRDTEEFNRCIKYICNNPFRAGLDPILTEYKWIYVR